MLAVEVVKKIRAKIVEDTYVAPRLSTARRGLYCIVSAQQAYTDLALHPLVRSI